MLTRSMAGVVPPIRQEVYIDMPTRDEVSRRVTD
jgi:hypothetical protein